VPLPGKMIDDKRSGGYPIVGPVTIWRTVGLGGIAFSLSSSGAEQESTGRPPALQRLLVRKPRSLFRLFWPREVLSSISVSLFLFCSLAFWSFLGDLKPENDVPLL